MGVSTAANRQYVWGVRYMDDLVLRDRDVAAGGDLGVTGSGLDERFYAMQDPNWNVAAIANVSGVVQERYRYTAYGTPTFMASTFVPRNPNTSAYAWDALYTGRHLDAETGLYQYRNRYYHAELGRFVNRDPIGYKGGDRNLYRYAGNSPTRFVDPTGLVWSTADFVTWYYIGGGAPITLEAVGLLGEFQNAADVQRSVGQFWWQTVGKVLDVAKGLDCTKGAQTKNVFYSDTDVTNVTWEPHLFAVGHSTFYRSASCTITVPDCKCCKPGSEIRAWADCTFSYKIKDSFKDPLDIGNETGGTVYDINAFWAVRTHEELVVPCPRK